MIIINLLSNNFYNKKNNNFKFNKMSKLTNKIQKMSITKNKIIKKQANLFN